MAPWHPAISCSLRFRAERGPATCGTSRGVDANAPGMEAQDGGLSSRLVPVLVLRSPEPSRQRSRRFGAGVLESFAPGASLPYCRRVCAHLKSSRPRVPRRDRRDSSRGRKRNGETRHFSEKERLARKFPAQRGRVLNQPGRKIDRKRAAIHRRKGFVRDPGGNDFEDARGRSLGVPQTLRHAIRPDPLQWPGLSTFSHFKR
jgi:hypothetical protein